MIPSQIIDGKKYLMIQPSTVYQNWANGWVGCVIEFFRQDKLVCGKIIKDNKHNWLKQYPKSLSFVTDRDDVHNDIPCRLVREEPLTYEYLIKRMKENENKI